jgi:ubiquinone/menaquinone biosynthesis C-methylase UbiE
MKLEKPFFPKDVQYIPQENHLTFESLSKYLSSELPAGSLILDLGCGSGPFTKRIKNQIKKCGHKLIGVDLLSKESNVLGDVHCLPFKNEIFDCVFSNCALEHFYNPKSAVMEVNRVLKPHSLFIGNVAFMEPFHKSYFNMSHWGIEYILRNSNFTDIKLQPGFDIFEVLSKYIFMENKRFKKLYAPTIKLPMHAFIFFVKHFICLFSRIKYGGKSKKYQEACDYYKIKFPYIMSGSIYFSARKRK